MAGKLSKARRKEVERYLNYCRLMIEAAARHQEASTPPDTRENGGGGGAQARRLPPIQGAGTAKPAKPPEESLPELKVAFEVSAKPVIEAVESHQRKDVEFLQLALQGYRLSFRTSFDQLMCLPTLRDVESLWYQEETARKVMKTFRGRAILADEVGLGKTIEAGIILKEYILRGLVRSALVLVPSSLLHQWEEELESKFGLSFVSSASPLFRQDPEGFWENPFMLASLQTAKTKRHFDAVTHRSYDMVIVDEAHRLKNRSTLAWKLVNSIQKTFLLMLTATPVQNSLEELYNLVTLLRPGHLKTQEAFKDEFITRGNPTDPRNREKLRQLLKEVMVRNTRSVARLRLPPRFILTVRVEPSEREAEFYTTISRFVAEHSSGDSPSLPKMTLRRLLEAAGSSHSAAISMLERIQANPECRVGEQVRAIMRSGDSIRTGSKLDRVIELVKASDEKKIIFVNYVRTLEHISRAMKDLRIPHAVYHGGLTRQEKQAAMDGFRGRTGVLLTTGSGGEGHNLQFCHVMINYDLPWNPMEIEQRIGRIHRFGQEKEVQVYNFCAAGSLEDHILEVLDRKINMFELVVGELDMILGRLHGEEEFADLVYEIWVKNAQEADRKKAFDALAARLKRARTAYDKTRDLDEKLFREDFGV